MVEKRLKIYRQVGDDYYRLIEGINVHKLEKQIGHIGLLDDNQPNLEDLPEFRFDSNDCLDFSTLIFNENYVIPYRSNSNEIFPNGNEQRTAIETARKLKNDQDVATIKFATYLNQGLNENGEKLNISLAIINFFYEP